jgi:hypothetical protein
VESTDFNFLELDAETRAHMLSELKFDVSSQGAPFLGAVLTARGRADYGSLLEHAIQTGTEADLVDRLNEEGRVVASPVDAARKLGRTEFNRYYIRGICLRAWSHDTNVVFVYRAHGSASPRSTSIALIDSDQPAPVVLANVRGSQGADPATGLGRVNSGLSIRCGCASCRVA